MCRDARVPRAPGRRRSGLIHVDRLVSTFLVLGVLVIFPRLAPARSVASLSLYAVFKPI